MNATTGSRPPTHRLDSGPIAGLGRAITATVDRERPRDGIACGADHLLGLDLRANCLAADHWIRGGDVVAVYEPDDPRRVRATALWRRWPALDAAAWELVVSATTAREQSDASLAVVSDVAAQEIVWGGLDDGRLQWQAATPASVACVLLRQTGGAGAGSILIAGHPADARQMLARQVDGRFHVECWLFSAAAEKGVLFRGRVLAAIGPTTDDTLWARRLWDEFSASPPMLTA